MKSCNNEEQRVLLHSCTPLTASLDAFFFFLKLPEEQKKKRYTCWDCPTVRPAAFFALLFTQSPPWCAQVKQYRANKTTTRYEASIKIWFFFSLLMYEKDCVPKCEHYEGFKEVKQRKGDSWLQKGNWDAGKGAALICSLLKDFCTHSLILWLLFK